MVEVSNNPSAWKNKMPTSVKMPIAIGMVTVAAFFGGFGYWAATVPISGAAVASGVIAASGLNQKVNHLEGGIISSIMIAEGDRVHIGQPLIKLDNTRVKADRDRLATTLLGLFAKEARAEAERDGTTDLTFAVQISDKAQQISGQNILRQQAREFEERYKRHVSDLGVLDQRVVATKEEISGLQVQMNSEETKLVIIKDELEQKKQLLKRGLTAKREYTALQREDSDTIGRIGSLKAKIAQRKTSILEIKQQVNGAQARRKETASAEINSIRREIGEFEEQLLAREDILKRVIIRSPADGIIVKLLKNTVGSVVRSSETILEILPTSSDLIVEARVAPQDIDTVRPGLNAKVRFTALNTRTTPEVDAIVSYVSADRLIDQDTRVPYYLARLQLSPTLPKEISRDQIFAGMPVDAFIQAGDRTFLEYLIRPITDSFQKAFREE